MKLHYKLEGNRLEGDNDITIKKLQLGEKIKSDQAKDLPLGLAIALLSDANGVIQMNLKVKGDLDQPDFSIGNIFWDVLGNTLSKAITSPSPCSPRWPMAPKISTNFPSCRGIPISPPPSRRNWSSWRRPSRIDPSSA